MAIQEGSISDFGLITAYLVPGVTVLLGLSQFSPSLRALFLAADTDLPTIGGFLYLTVGSIAVGMTVSAIRWLVVDQLHAATGLRQPVLDFGNLGEKVDAFRLLIEIHYRHYLFYANMAVATAVSFGTYRYGTGNGTVLGFVDLGFFLAEVVFITTSRDTLRKYYSRTQQLLGSRLKGLTVHADISSLYT